MKLLKEETLLDLKKNLLKKTCCAVQHDGWSCNSCFHNIEIKLKDNIHQYWLAVLFFRGDYLDCDWSEYDTSNFAELIEELNNQFHN